MRKRYNKNKTRSKFYRTNERIFANELRVLDLKGKQIGILNKREALEIAREKEMDLVEIAPFAKPPVARVIDFKKFLYQEEKKRREEKKKSKNSETKEIRLGPFMDDHDLETMIRRAREFLEGNDKVKLVVRFKGRQMGHPEFGHQVIGKAISRLSDISKVDKEAHFEGRQLISMLSPDKKKKHEEEQEKNQEVGKQTL
ncbi:MAG: translation initiation factor IF-3 [Candidatus Levybacteria bacterium]|nr:translation initiation factor IF-3 [Candidatus Levybacteria bacterium]